MAQMSEEIILNVRANFDAALKTITEYSARVQELTEENKKLDLSNAAQAKQYEANKAAINECNYSMRVLRKEVQNNIREQNSHEGSLKQMRAQLSQLTKRYDEMSATERKAANQTGGLKDQIKQLTAQLKEAEQGTDRFYRNVGNYENSIKSALGLNNSFADSLLNLARNGEGGGGIKNMMQGATQAVKSFGSALMSLMANPAFLTIAGLAGAGAAFKFFYDYNQGLAEATRLTREFMGIEGDALRSVRDNIQATADVFGKDYKDVLSTVDALMAQYHLSAEEAIKVVNDGFVAGADLSGNFLNQLNQYAPSFHDAGVGASELVAILAQTRSGIFSDKGMDIISMASKRIREMSTTTAQSLDAIGISSKQVEKDLQTGAKSTFDVIQMVSAKLRELPQNGQEVGEVLKNVFGKTAADGGLQMIEMLDTMTTKIDDVKAVTGEYGQMQEEQLDAQRELNDAVSTLFDVSEGGFETVIGHIKIFLTRFLTKIIKGVTDVINWVIELYNNSIEVRGAVQFIVAAVRQLWNTAKVVFSSIVTVIKSVAKAAYGLGEIFIGIVQVKPSLIKQGVQRIGNTIVDGIKDIGDSIKDYTTEAAQIAVDAWNNTMTKEKVKPLGSAIGVDSGTGGGTDITGGTGGNNAAGGAKSGGTGGRSSAARAAAQRAKETEQLAKDEREQLARLEQLKNQLIEDAAERQRATINANYDKQIADVRAKLAEEGKHTVAARAAMVEQVAQLERLRAQALAKVDEDEMRRMVELENRRINLKLQAVRKGAAEEYALRLQQMDNEQALEAANIRATISNEETKNAMLLDLDAAYQEKRAQLAEQYRQQEREAVTLAMQNDINEKMLSAQTEMERLALELQQAQFLRDTAEQRREESEEQWRARRLQLEQAYEDKRKEIAQKEIEIEQAKGEAVAQITGAMSDMFGQLGEENKDFAVLSKMLAIAEVSIQQGIAIANAVRAATEGSHTWWEAAAAIATGVATVTASIMSAMKTIKGAKFATGGRVTGAGSGTSDSIPAWLSDGETVINARSSAMFTPLLSALNQLGGGIPVVGVSPQMQVGEDYLAAAVAKGMAYAPRPVVDVQEIATVANRVQVIENKSVL